jgi:hypothetical protein
MGPMQLIPAALNPQTQSNTFMFDAQRTQNAWDHASNPSRY